MISFWHETCHLSRSFVFLVVLLFSVYSLCVLISTLSLSLSVCDGGLCVKGGKLLLRKRMPIK
uniref:Uncharacterized protein n=1 Tax=Rhizophora mucronata TaxID=61149 RepID=A0A2P2QE77_RHIMU